METTKYWVMRSARPRRNLCSDGVIRKTLKDAPAGTNFMKFRTKPDDAMITKMVKEGLIKDSNHLIFLRSFFVGELDYHCPSTGAIYNNGNRDIIQRITDSGIFEL